MGLAQEKVELLQVSLDVCPLGKGTTINKKFASFTVFKFHDLCRKVVGSQWVKTKKALRFAQLVRMQRPFSPRHFLDLTT